jgi:hypothetical protein
LLVLQKPESIDYVINAKGRGIESDDLLQGFNQIVEMVIVCEEIVATITDRLYRTTSRFIDG